MTYQDDQDEFVGSIIVVDDDQMALKNLRRVLEKAGHRVSTFKNPLRAMKRLEKEACDLIISDVKMPHMDGISFLNQVKRLLPDIEVILITGYASLDGAVDATKQGAFHYLSKPFTPDQIRIQVSQALREKFLRDKSKNREGLQSSSSGPVMIGKSPRIVQVEEVIRQIAPTDCSVLIIGESGTGKELAAQLIHAHSGRARGPFVAFNCGAFTEELIANELFGHEKDAYTGATSRKPGLLETANGGTLFMDEIGDMPLSMQIRLLRFIQEREIIRVGGTRPITLDVRILAATAKDLKTAVADGDFRQDLYFRLNVVNIVLPRLVDRKQDIPLLAYHILDRCRRQNKKKIKAISREAMTIIENYAFPGNVRELENILEHAVALCRGQVIQVRDLPPDLVDVKLYSYRRSMEHILSLEELEQDYIRHVLQLTGGVRTKTAEILGIDRASLWRKMKKHGLE